jgi:hypothetical protein
VCSSDLKRQLRERLLALPDNPHIRRIPGAPRCFLMNSADLGSAWSAEYHDFRHQYETLADAVDRLPLEAGVRLLIDVVDRGSSKIGRGKTQPMQFHPDVRAAVGRLLQEVGARGEQEEVPGG